jgi:hypothetical protein
MFGYFLFMKEHSPLLYFVMARFNEEEYEAIDHSYLTRDRLIKQIHKWFPGHVLKEYIMEYDFSESATREGIDMMPQKQLIHIKSQRYVGWFSDSHFIPYKPPIPVLPEVYKNPLISHRPV